MTVGTEEPRLIVLRGNSASGKSSVAAGLRDRFGRGLALVGQDNRHATKAVADEVGEPQLRDLYRDLDLPPGGIEAVVGADNTLTETVGRVMAETGLAGLPPPIAEGLSPVLLHSWWTASIGVHGAA